MKARAVVMGAAPKVSSMVVTNVELKTDDDAVREMRKQVEDLTGTATSWAGAVKQGVTAWWNADGKPVKEFFEGLRANGYLSIEQVSKAVDWIAPDWALPLAANVLYG